MITLWILLVLSGMLAMYQVAAVLKHFEQRKMGQPVLQMCIAPTSLMVAMYIFYGIGPQTKNGPMWFFGMVGVCLMASGAFQFRYARGNPRIQMHVYWILAGFMVMMGLYTLALALRGMRG